MHPFTLETLTGLLCDSEHGPRLPYAEARKAAMLCLDSLGHAFVHAPFEVQRLLESHAPRPQLRLTEIEPE